MAQSIIKNKKEIDIFEQKIVNLTNDKIEKDQLLHDLMSKIDLYSRLDEFVNYGHYEVPEYLHETSERFSEEIKHVRADQKELIKDKEAVLFEDSSFISSQTSLNNSIMNGQIKLMLTSFNVECDNLIGNVKPSNYGRVLECIEKLANALEKSSAGMTCEINTDYVELKFEECTLQYQYSLKKQEE